jgi:hypothetical protein
MEAIPDESLRVVVFLCVDEPRESGVVRVPKATGLFVKVPGQNSPNNDVDYVVTARHCIDEARQFKHIYIRVNRKNDKFIEFPTNVEDWYSHDNADVAAIPILRHSLPKGMQPEDLECTAVLISSFVGGSPNYEIVLGTQYDNKVIQPRIGHQVYLLGLFTEHYGIERNLPIARFGHISRMPELVHVKINNTNIELMAYLIEFHSLGGHSGSPVFFLYPMLIEDQRTLQFEDGKKLAIPVAVNFVWHTGFLGLVSGHYDIEQEAQKTGDILGEIQVGLNSGIAFVTPAEAVTQLLMREDLKEYRNNLGKMAETKRPKPILDVAKSKESYAKHAIAENQYHSLNL